MSGPHAVSGFTMLVQAVQQFFEANGWIEEVRGGWKEREQILNQGPRGASRVVFIPGRLTPGSSPGLLEAGEISQPRIKSNFSGAGVQNPRPLRQWARIVTVSIWAVDADRLDDELAQIEAAETLLEKVIQATHNALFVDPDSGFLTPAGLADLEWSGNVLWGVFSPNMQFGRELVAYFTHKGPLYDQPEGIAFPQPAIVKTLKQGPIP